MPCKWRLTKGDIDVKKKEKKRILCRLLAKEFSEEFLKQVSGGTLSHCGQQDYDDETVF
jgi:hypothetical protein